MKDSLHLLKTRRFLPLFIAQFFGAFNDNAFKNAFLIWFTYEAAQKSGFDAGLMVTIAAGLFILPFFLFSATAGQLADKYEKSFLVRWIKLIEIILMVVAAIGFYLESVNLLLAILFMMGLHSTFFGPIKYSLLPEHLKDNELIAGNGLIEGGTFLAILLGTIFGGVIIRSDSGIELFSVAVILFAVIGLISSQYIPLSPVGDKKLKIGWNIAKETWKIAGYAREERTVWLSIIGISWFWLVGATFLTQFPVYTKEVIGGNEHIVTLFLSIFSIGIGIGSVLCNKLLKGKIDGRLVPYGSIGMTVGIILFYLFSSLYIADHTSWIATKSHPDFFKLNSFPNALPDKMLGIMEFLTFTKYGWLILASLLVLSVCGGVYIVPLYAIMQHRSDNKYISRIIAANNVMNALFMVLASVIIVYLYSIGLSVNKILLAAGIGNIFVFLIVRKIVKARLTKRTE